MINSHRWLKWLGLSCSAGALLATTLLLSQHRSGTPTNRVVSTAAMMEQPVIIEHQGERTRWQLHAVKAEESPSPDDQQTQNADKMHLTQPRLEIFSDHGERITIQGDDAWFDPLKRHARFIGHVTIDYKPWLLQSAEALFDGVSGTLHIRGAFSAHGDRVTMHGADLTIDQAQQQLRVRRHITIEDQR
ncbi:MAG: hypothetical protein Q9M13_02555 [Mariprofundales bacterium]|nr:hypothetical protein [Mariprofundales bacterium]